MNTKRLISKYISDWQTKGYPDDIPDSCPDELESLGIVPSYRLVCKAILKNDMNLYSLGMPQKKSLWYGAIKRNEIAERESKK